MSEPERTVAVFGASEPLPGDPLYEDARRVGADLARAGFAVLTGGYGGVMDAASRGAVEAGGIAIGVTTAIFADRLPSAYLSRVIETACLNERMRVLVERAGAYVVLWGKSGTLAEATLVWALERAGSLEPRPVILLGGSWSRLLDLLIAEGMLGAVELAATRAVERPEEVVPLLAQLRGGPGRM